ncbi:MAG: hypothetical protein GC202_02880 [Alphaproteobacteria bacterium]|nr:hypothetical protein [Alphaproteobacteria bacterium]
MAEAPAEKPKLDEKRKLELQNVLNRCSVITGIFDTRMDNVNCKAFHAIREIMDIYLGAAIRQISANVDFIDEGVKLKDEEKKSLEDVITKIFGDLHPKAPPPAAG